MFEIEYTDEFGEWFDSLSDKQQLAIAKRLDLLAQQGPALRRPVVAEIKGSRFDPQMKELRVGSEGALRILFMFDPRRQVILLTGGDKTGSWNAWYAHAIPAADNLYDIYLSELRDEGLLP